MDDSAHRAGYIAIVGRPNVGKSTLLNRLVGHKISITSRKPQTTRFRITGILTRADAQLVFVDTPGFQTQHASALNQLMNRAVTQSLRDVDVVLLVLEANRIDERDAALERLIPQGLPLVVALNKIDQVRDKGALLPVIRELHERFGGAEIVPVSARQGLGVQELIDTLVPLLPQGPRLYDEDEITDASERQLAAELIREKLFRLLGDEIPYATAVRIERFETRGGLRRIQAEIIVDRESQKPIVIGRGGERLKDIATRARLDMEELFGGKVFLEVWVKVKKGWADDENALKRMGYG